MAGSPLKRARKQGVRLADGSIIAFPYMPRVLRAPAALASFLDGREDQTFARPRSLRDPVVAAGPVVALDKGASHPHVFRICAKAMLHGTLGREVARERERAEALKKLVRDLPGDEYGENRRVVRNCLNGTKIRSDRTGI
jgi:hypothetical protein